MKQLAHVAGSPAAPYAQAPERRQAALVTLAVLLAHVGLLGWLPASSGPMQPPLPTIVAMELLAGPAPEQASKPAPQPEPRQSKQPVPKPTPRQAPKQASPAVTHAEPGWLPSAEPSLAPAAVAGTGTTATATAAQAATPSGQSQATAPAPARVELPSASADYLNNPKPAYPPLSRRLREEGKVVLLVLIETDGGASRAEIRSSSGYERLDQAALQTVLRWRYVPARRNGVPEAMWFNVPINFVLE